MKILNLKIPFLTAWRMPKIPGVLLTLGLLTFFWPLAQQVVQMNDAFSGGIDPNIYLCIMLSLMCFLGLLGICWWLLAAFWAALGLPALKGLVVHFKSMEIWAQLGFYFLCFALLLLAGVGCLIAIC